MFMKITFGIIDTTNYNQTANFLNSSITGFNSAGNYVGERFLGETSYKGLWFFLKIPYQIQLKNIQL